MSPYFIFIIVLTVLYIVYFSVMIVRDLYGKTDETTANQAETFDVSDFQEEDTAITVTESDNGFSVGDNQYETNYEETPPEQAENEKPQADLASQLENKLKDQLEETEVSYSDEVNREEMTRIMLSKGLRKDRPQVVVIPQKDIL